MLRDAVSQTKYCYLL